MYIYIYIYICMCMYIYIYIYNMYTYAPGTPYVDDARRARRRARIRRRCTASPPRRAPDSLPSHPPVQGPPHYQLLCPYLALFSKIV